MKFDSFFKFHVFYVVGLLGMLTAIVCAAYYDLWWWLLAGFIYARVTMLLGAHIGLHRYFAHSAFKTTPFKHKLIAWLSFLSGEGSPIMWFIHHNHHHVHADKELDIANPREEGVIKACMWNLRTEEHWKQKQVKIFPRRLYRDSTVRFIHENYFKIWIVLSILTLLIDWKVFLFLLLFPVGHNNFVGVVAAVLLHVKMPGSYRNFETDDLSWNNQYQVYVMLGEGYHNNHHRYPNAYNQAMRPGEFDLGGWVVEKFFLEKNK